MKAAGLTLLAVALVFLTHHAFIVGIEYTPFYRWQVAVLHWRYLHQAVFCLIVPVAAMYLLKREPSLYGIVWNCETAFAIATVFGLTLALPLSVDAISGGLRLRGDAAYIVSTVLFQIVFSGFGEELYCRGMIQGEVDRAMGRDVPLFGARVGLGVVVGGLFFGLGHLGLTDALHGSHLHVQAFLYTTLLGCFLGYLRAYTGNVFVVGAVHGGLDTYQYLVVPGFGGIVHFMAVGAVMYLVLGRILYRDQKATS